ncbi:MAG: glycosyltransferase family 4 protein [Phycisphaerales bacterium]
MLRLLVEGWRFCPNSFSVLNQYQLVELLRRPDVKLFHRDIPYDAKWWKWERGLLPADQEAAIERLPDLAPGERADVCLRISHPYRISRSPDADQTFVFGTAELGIIEDLKIPEGRKAREALATRDATFLTCSKWSAQGFVRSGADADNIAVAHLGFDPASFKPPTFTQRDALRKKLNWEGKFVFLNVSTLSWYKGIHPLLFGFGLIAQKHPNTLLAIKGADSLWKMDERLQGVLNAMPAQLRTLVSERIRYVGKTLSHAEVAEMYQAGDCYLTPYHGEGFNMPVLEAAACGMPTIATAGGPTDEFTSPDFFLPIKSTSMSNPDLERSHGVGAIALRVDGDSLVAQMERAITDDNYRTRAFIAGPEYVRTRYTWKHTVDKMIDAFTTKNRAACPAFNWNR